MNKIQTVDAMFDPAVKFSPTTWGVLDATDFSVKRAEHIINHVLAPKLRVFPSTLFFGEAEALMLLPLHGLALKIRAGEFKRDMVLDFYANEARAFGIVATIIASAMATKPGVNEFGKIAYDNATLTRLMEKEVGKPKPKPDGSAEATNYLRDLLSKSIGSLKNNPADYVPGSKVFAFTKEDSMGKIAQLTQYAGKGTGAPLFVSEYPKVTEMISDIERAARILLDPKLASPDASDTLERCPLDAYALVLGLLSYLHYGFDRNNYDAKFPPEVVAATTQIQMQSQMRLARMFAWHYAALATSAQMADAELALNLAETTVKFFEPILYPELSEMKDIKTTLEYAKRKISATVFGPVSDHSQALFKWFKTVYGTDELLPGFMTSFFQMPEPVEFPLIPVGSTIYNAESRKDSFILMDTAMEYLPRLKEIALATRMYADSVAAQLQDYFLSLESASEIHSLGIPSDLLITPVIVHPLSEITYSNAFVREFIPLSIPRYVYDQKVLETGDTPSPEWVLKPYTFGSISMYALRNTIYNRADVDVPRYVYDVKIDLPTGMTMSEKYAKMLIPHPYVAHGWYSSIPNNMKSVYDYLLQSRDKRWTQPNPFKDMAAALETSPLFRDSIVKSLASMFRIARKASEDGKWVWMTPRLTSIYGIPTPSFITIQQDYADSDLDKILAYPSAGSKAIKVVVPVRGSTAAITTNVRDVVEYAFILHDKLPNPTEVLNVPELLDPGCYVSVPVSSVFMDSAIKYINDKYPLTDGAFEMLPDQQMGAIIQTVTEKLSPKEVKKLVPNKPLYGWATIYGLLPHIFFDYQPSRTEVLGNGSLLWFTTKIRTSASPAGSMIQVSASLEDDLVGIVPADEESLLSVGDLELISGKTSSIDNQTITPTKQADHGSHGSKTYELEDQNVTPTEEVKVTGDSASAAELVASITDIASKPKSEAEGAQHASYEPPRKEDDDEDGKPKKGRGGKKGTDKTDKLTGDNK